MYVPFIIIILKEASKVNKELLVFLPRRERNLIVILVHFYKKTYNLQVFLIFKLL